MRPHLDEVKGQILGGSRRLGSAVRYRGLGPGSTHTYMPSLHRSSWSCNHTHWLPQGRLLPSICPSAGGLGSVPGAPTYLSQQEVKMMGT